jgi:alginate O-acetyltransferase complex protein AlgI
MITWGFFKKMVIADRAAEYVNTVYGAGWETQLPSSLALATVLFAVQIYADFSGYSSIAVGCARVMGFDLMRNFRHPYFASGITDFWARWHISLSTWFRDYLYIPLGGSRVSTARHYWNLLITFAISGLWHGANWTFVTWGIYNGILLIIEQALPRSWSASALLRTAGRFAGLVAIVFGWIFFRSTGMHQALAIIRRICSSWHFDRLALQQTVLQFALDNTSLAVNATTLFLIGVMFLIEYRTERNGLSFGSINIKDSLLLKGIVIVVLFQAIMFFGVLSASSFIYYQF